MIYSHLLDNNLYYVIYLNISQIKDYFEFYLKTSIIQNYLYFLGLKPLATVSFHAIKTVKN